MVMSRLYLQKGTEHPHFCLVRAQHMTLVLYRPQLLGLVLCSPHHINWLPFITTTTSSHLPPPPPPPRPHCSLYSLDQTLPAALSIERQARDVCPVLSPSTLHPTAQPSVHIHHQPSQYLMMTLLHIKLTEVVTMSFIA